MVSAPDHGFQGSQKSDKDYLNLEPSLQRLQRSSGPVRPFLMCEMYKRLKKCLRVKLVIFAPYFNNCLHSTNMI